MLVFCCLFAGEELQQRSFAGANIAVESAKLPQWHTFAPRSVFSSLSLNSSRPKIEFPRIRVHLILHLISG